MRRRLNIPREVRDAIEVHVQERLAEVNARHWSAAEDEDTFTGHLGALLGTSEKTVIVNDQPWRWSIDYTKFRGRGLNATESALGADGIFEVRVHGIEIEGHKSVIFQAKMGEPSGRRAIEQALAMSNWREAAVFVSYDEDAITVYPIDSVIRGDLSQNTSFVDFFNKSLLACRVGDSDLLYDAQARRLEWRDDKGRNVAIKFPIPHRLRVSVKSPFTRAPRYSLISANRIGDHRMDSSPEERLGVGENFTLKQLTTAKREAALTFHPDRRQDLADPLKNILNKRMAEVNDAFAYLKSKKRRNWGDGLYDMAAIFDPDHVAFSMVLKALQSFFRDNALSGFGSLTAAESGQPSVSRWFYRRERQGDSSKPLLKFDCNLQVAGDCQTTTNDAYDEVSTGDFAGEKITTGQSAIGRGFDPGLASHVLAEWKRRFLNAWDRGERESGTNGDRQGTCEQLRLTASKI
jgi:hypothetical protein